MTDKKDSPSATPVSTIRHLAMIIGAVLLLVSFGQPWVEITLTTGQTVSPTGIDQSPLALSLILTAVAAYALSLLVHGLSYRLTTLVQAGASLGALAAVITAVVDPVSPAASQITLLTGLSGDNTVASLVAAVSVSEVVVGFGVVGLALVAISGGLAVTVTRTPQAPGSRFDRPGSPSTQNPWDQLSDGVDPTDL